ncbi:unnamed protein product [Cochlearia groenlandica]
MESKSRSILIMILAIMTIVLQMRPGLAQVSNIPGFSASGSPIDIAKCWSFIFDVQGCVQEIYDSIFLDRLDNVGTACCEAFLVVDTSCWPHMFPSNPFFPHLLRDNCARFAMAPLATHK